MSQLSSEARRVVAISRRADDPSATDQKRVRLALTRKLGAGASATLVGVGAAKAAAGATALAGVGKSVVVASASIVLSLALWQSQAIGPGSSAHKFVSATASNETRGAVNPNQRGLGAQVSMQQPPRAVSAEPERESGAAPSGSSNPTLAVTSRQPAATRLESGASHTITKPAVDAPYAATSVETPTVNAQDPERAKTMVDPLQAETAALREAQRVLRSGDPARAIALIDEQDSAYRSGALGQERAAARVYALCALGNVAQAHSDAQQFARRWPRSPMLSRVRAACGSP
jgi:hypothetical protein